MHELNLDMIDTDGAIRETHEAATAGSTRLDFLKKAGIGAAGLASGGAILSALAPSAMAATSTAPPASFGAGDIGILNYALTLEYLERAFYNAATSNNIVKDPILKGILETATRDERAHVTFLKKALGSKAVAEPKFNFGAAVKDEKTFAATSFVLENTGVHAYSGQAGNIKTPAYLLAALSIVTIEARHAGAIGSYLKHTPTEISPSGSFDTGLSAAKVLAAVKSTGFIVS
jgi:Ferritin-like domain